MSNNLQKLKEIGIQKIHEQTHISRKHTEALLNEDFAELNKIQFLGFVSILEREYELQLDELRESGISYFAQTDDAQAAPKKLFLTPKKKKSHTKIYLFLVVLVFAGVVFYTTSLHQNKLKNYEKNDTSISLAVVEESNNSETNGTYTVTTELNTTEDKPVLEKPQEPKKEVVTVEKSLKIIPRRKLWMGYMDLDTGTKKQKLFSGAFTLDPGKRWLLFLGHGNVDFDINGKITKFYTKKNIKLLYENSKLKKVDFEEFKRLNKGDKW